MACRENFIGVGGPDITINRTTQRYCVSVCFDFASPIYVGNTNTHTAITNFLNEVVERSDNPADVIYIADLVHIHNHLRESLNRQYCPLSPNVLGLYLNDRNNPIYGSYVSEGTVSNRSNYRNGRVICGTHLTGYRFSNRVVSSNGLLVASGTTTFINNTLVRVPLHSSAQISVRSVYTMYLAFALENRFSPVSARVFTNTLISQGFRMIRQNTSRLILITNAIYRADADYVDPDVNEVSGRELFEIAREYYVNTMEGLTLLHRNHATLSELADYRDQRLNGCRHMTASERQGIRSHAAKLRQTGYGENELIVSYDIINAAVETAAELQHVDPMRLWRDLATQSGYLSVGNMQGMIRNNRIVKSKLTIICRSIGANIEDVFELQTLA